MPRFFIHTQQAGMPRDVFGQILPDLHAMNAMTLAYAGDLLKDANDDGSASKLRVQVTDEKGQRVASVSIDADMRPSQLPPHLNRLDGRHDER